MSDTEPLYANVVVDLPLSLNAEQTYYYRIPAELKEKIKPGSVVHIPFGKQELNAYTISLTKNPDMESARIKSIYHIVEENIWSDSFLKIAKEISDYYYTNIGTVLSASVSMDMFDNFTHEIKLLKDDFESTSDHEKFILEKLLSSKNKKLSYKSVYQKAEFSKSRLYTVINSLKNKGFIEVNIKQKNKTKKIRKEKLWKGIKELETKPCNKFVLNKDQKNAFTQIKNSLEKSKVFLLHGVTGSGKTEIYLNLIEEVLLKNQTAIYLVPEIYLIPQTYERLKSRFGEESIIVWHSNLSKAERLDNWEKILKEPEKVKIILGARSAILSPIKNTGIIIIDEAHESSYKQNSPAPRYDAVKVAEIRSKYEKCPVVLGTATPNVEDYFHAVNNQTLLELPLRINDIPMPTVKLIDVKNEPNTYGKTLTRSVENSIRNTLSRNEQVVILLNRRGYASNVFCMECGESVHCKNCAIPVVYHKADDSMVCHHCGFSKSYNQTYGALKNKCSNCKGSQFNYIGIGTEQLEEEIIKTFPEAKVVRADRDALKKKDNYLKIWDEFSSGKANILLGTQIVAKGLDLPNVTLVCVISPDTILNFPDFISYEKGFQLLTQVAGRAGRGEKPGQVLIQTYKADEAIYEYVIKHDYENFYKNEIKNREEHFYPPFSFITRIIIQGFNESECLEYSKEVSNKLKEVLAHKSLPQNVLGPAPCFFSKIQRKYRFHLLLKLKDHSNRKEILDTLLKEVKSKQDTDIVIDIDSVNLL